MAKSPTEHRFASFDGTQLAWYELGPEGGGGRPLILLHGLFSNARTNWLKFGTAEALAGAGHRCLMLDFRAHGQSEAPTDAAAYPENVLAKDALAFIERLDLEDYDLAGFSLGGRTAAHAVIGGAAPRRLAICGMGLAGITDQAEGTSWFLDMIEGLGTHAKGSDEHFAELFMKTNEVDPLAASHLLRAQHDADSDALAAIEIPTAIICGREDHYFADAEALARHMPAAELRAIAGTHMSSVTKPELAAELIAFLAA